jgi:hypothetical protein
LKAVFLLTSSSISIGVPLGLVSLLTMIGVTALISTALATRPGLALAT